MINKGLKRKNGFFRVMSGANWKIIDLIKKGLKHGRHNAVAIHFAGKIIDLINKGLKLIFDFDCNRRVGRGRSLT